MRLQLRVVMLPGLLATLLAAAAVPAVPHPAEVSDIHGARQATAAETVTSFIISNEAPGHLVDYLIAQGHGDETLLAVLGYLKDRSGGIISDAFYGQVAGAPPGSEVFTSTLGNYAGLAGGIEICADGTLYIPSVEANDYDGATGYATSAGQDGQFTITYAQDVAHYIYTHSKKYGSGVRKQYYAFGIAWRGSPIPTPTATRTPGAEKRSYLPLLLK